MKKEIQIPNSLGFCKKCFRSKREGSAYCGQCQNEPARMKIYQCDEPFPLLQEVIKKFELSPRILESVAFTYGDNIYAERTLHYSLLAHELTHIFQQLETGRDKWWGKYLNKKKFRLKQELEAYCQQYKVYKMNDPAGAEVILDKLARDLSSPLYGMIIEFEKAREKIKNGDCG